MPNSIFSIATESDFNAAAIAVFNYQAINNVTYKKYIDLLGIDIKTISTIQQIPFLPISFFKTHAIISGKLPTEITFSSSGTSGYNTSKHEVCDLQLYKASFLKSFQLFYGNPKDYCFIALLPSYLEREGSSLIYMIDEFISQSTHPLSGFYPQIDEKFITMLRTIENQTKGKVVLWGVTFALLQLAEQYEFDLRNFIVMETGGMKGRRKELTRYELYEILTEKLHVQNIHSEYGMTELLSQAYSKNDGNFACPPWMKILIREVNDPFTLLPINKTGAINVIDLANYYSCSFIATDDAGKLLDNNSFEVLGRIDNSDMRGCNLMVSL